MGVVRHVDAGYDRAIEVARERGVRIPMLDRRPQPNVDLASKRCARAPLDGVVGGGL